MLPGIEQSCKWLVGGGIQFLTVGEELTDEQS